MSDQDEKSSVADDVMMLIHHAAQSDTGDAAAKYSAAALDAANALVALGIAVPQKLPDENDSSIADAVEAVAGAISELAREVEGLNIDGALMILASRFGGGLGGGIGAGSAIGGVPSEEEK